MKTISDATGIAGKRGVRILILPHHRTPERDSQRRLGSHARASSGPHAPLGREIFVWNTKNVFGASFEGRCVFFFGAFEVMRIFC